MISGWVVVCIALTMLLAFAGGAWLGYIAGTAKRNSEGALEAALASLPRDTLEPGDTFELQAIYAENPIRRIEQDETTFILKPEPLKRDAQGHFLPRSK